MKKYSLKSIKVDNITPGYYEFCKGKFCIAG